MTGQAPDTVYKQATVAQWTADPCGSDVAEGEPGTPEYFEALRRGRLAYAPWMPAALGYATTRGLDVLDVGCGQGLDLVQYAMAGARAVGVDLTPRHVELARLHLAALGLDGEVAGGDAESLPFPDASFDRASSNGVLHHTPDIEAALREIRRVLRPGGRATIIVYNKSSLHYWVNQFLLHGLIERQLREEGSMAGVLSRGVEYSTTDARPLVRVYSPRQVRRLMRGAGFANVSTKVRQYQHGDAFLLDWLTRRKWATPERTQMLGRLAGWYVVATGERG